MIKIETTPNPNALKFILNKIVSVKSISFKNLFEVKQIPLVFKILSLTGISDVFLKENFITITKHNYVSWEVLEGSVVTIIKENIDNHNPTIKNSGEKYKSPNITRIERIIDKYIKNYLGSDGGGLEVVDLIGDYLSIKLLGSCASCIASKHKTLEYISETLQKYYKPDIKIVVV